MSIRSERIKALVEGSDMSYTEIEKLTGIKKSSLQRYASGTTTKIPMEVFEKLSVAFNVSQEYLLGWDDKENNPSERQLDGVDKELFDALKQMPREQKLVLLSMIRGSANTPNKD